MIASFLISACLTIISTCLYLLLRRCGGGENVKQAPDDFNPLDRFIRRRLGEPIVRFLCRVPWIRDNMERVMEALFGLVQSLGDTQLVTGIAMLSAAIFKLNRGSITVYHFNMVTNLAWFSSNVHLLALLALRTQFLRSLKKGQRREYSRNGGQSRFWASLNRGADVLVRVMFMLLLAGLLLYCAYVSGAEGWNDNYNCPASCGFDMPRGGIPLRWTIANFVLVIWAYPTRCLLLWPLAGSLWIDKLRHRVVDDKGLGTTGVAKEEPALWWQVFAGLWYFLASETFEVFFDGFIWFGLGVWWTLDDRSQMHDFWGPTESEKENSFEGFGQLLPLLLLGLPFIQVLSTYCGKLMHLCCQVGQNHSNVLVYVADRYRKLERLRRSRRPDKYDIERLKGRDMCPVNFFSDFSILIPPRRASLLRVICLAYSPCVSQPIFQLQDPSNRQPSSQIL